MCPTETRHFKTAAEFIHALRRSEPYWLPADSWEVPWIFRGESSDEWELIPSAWRKTARSHEIYKFASELSDLDSAVANFLTNNKGSGFDFEENKQNIRPYIVQGQFEYRVAKAFADLVDDLGFPMPGGRLPQPSSLNMTWFDEKSALHPIIGLAQHHRMPTRLLDWTQNPLIAAFFAADGAPTEAKGNLVVWALDRRRLAGSRCHEFRVERNLIGFLHAQEGLFTYTGMADYEFLEKGAWPSLQSIIPDGLRRLTLPKSEAHNLLRLLWAERISRAHLMPTLDNVAHALHSVWKLALLPAVPTATTGGD
jgi:hypothetical protein